MTCRERIAAALKHKDPDRTPIFEYVLLSPLADRLLGRRYAGDPAHWKEIVTSLGWKQAVRQIALDQLHLALLLGHDMMYVIPGPPAPAPRDISSSPRTPSPPRSPDDPVERMRLRNQRSAAAPPPREDVLQVYVCLKEEMRLRGVDLPILAPCYVHGVWDDVDLMETMVLAPAVAHEHFSLATRHALKRVEQFLSLGIDQFGVGGDFSGTRPLISPECYREFIVPQVRQITRRVHQAGGHAVNASDGNLWPVLDDFLFGCEADGYLEIDMHAGMDLRQLKLAYGDRITFYGNLDCGNILSFATPAEVAAHVHLCLEAGMGNGGHILCASNAITASVPLDNYLAAVNAYRDTFNIPRFHL